MMKNLFIGELNRRIIIQDFTITTNDYNESKKTWTTHATVWAKMVSRTGRESYQSDQLTAIATTAFYVRYRTDLDTRMRIVFEGTVYKITSITEPAGFRKTLLELNTELVPEEEV